MAERLHTSRTPFQPGPRNSKLYLLTDVVESFTAPAETSPSTEQNSIANEIQSEELRLAKIKREKAEIELNAKRGEWMEISKVLAAIGEEYAIIRTRLQSLPSRLSMQLANLTDAEEVHKFLTEVFDETLSELKSDALKELEKMTDGVQVNETSEHDGTANSSSGEAPEPASADPEAEAAAKPS